MRIIFFLLLTPLFANAQWTPNGTNIYNTNTGNVGIGTNNPLSRLSIFNVLLDRKRIEESSTLDMSSYPRGIYILNIYHGDMITQRKIVKN